MARSNASGGHGSRQVKNNTAGRKVEPRPRAVAPGAASQLGSQMGNHVTEMGAKMKPWGGSVPLYSGRGYSAPTAANVNSKTDGDEIRVAGSPWGRQSWPTYPRSRQAHLPWI
jgi:hypothetical protein